MYTNQSAADPPRDWRRVGIMTGAWALTIVLGSMLAPSLVAGPAQERTDPRDLPPGSVSETVYGYLRAASHGSDEDQGRARGLLCDGAAPELDPAAIWAMTDETYDRIGGATGVDVDVLNELATTDGEATTVPVYYYVNASTRRERIDLTVTVRAVDGSWCVVDAARTPTAVDPELIPHDVAGSYFAAADAGDFAAAEELQCPAYTGASPEEIAAITVPIYDTAEGTVYRNSSDYEMQEITLDDGGLRVVFGFDYVDESVTAHNIRASFDIAVDVYEGTGQSCMASVAIQEW